MKPSQMIIGAFLTIAFLYLTFFFPLDSYRNFRLGFKETAFVELFATLVMLAFWLSIAGY